MPEEDWRGEFTRSLLELFLDHDVDPGDLRGRDAEVDGLLEIVDPEVEEGS